MTDDEIDKLAKAIAKATSSGNTGGIGPSTPSSGGGGSGIGSKAQAQLEKATGGLAGEVSSSAKTWQQASNIGIGFNNDAIGLRTSIAQTRLSTDEWGDSIKKGAVGFTALGGTMTDSAKKFNQMSASFSDTTAADELRKIGFTTKEYNDVLAISLASKKGQDLATLEGQRKANMAAADLALEMDKVAQLTGVSRREQQEALMEKQKNARVQATIELEIRKGGKDAADAYMKMTTNLKGIGLDKLGDELYTGQALSQKAIAQMNALGPAGVQLREAINATKNARTDEEKQAAKLMMDRAQSAVSERQRSTEYLTMVQRGQGEVAEAAGEGLIAARNYNKGIEEVQAEFKAQGKNLTTEQARQVLAERARKPVDIATGKDKTSAEANAAKTTEAYVLASARAADTTAKLASAVNDVNKSITGLGTATRKAIDDLNAGMANIKASNQKPGQTTTARDRLGIVNSEGLGNAVTSAAQGNMKEAGKQFGVGAVETLKNIKEIVTGAINVTGGILNGNKATPSRPQYADGTGGAGFDINKLVQNFGKATTVDLHGEEAVMTKKQLGDMITGLMGNKNKPDLSSMPIPKIEMPGAPSAAQVIAKASEDKKLQEINRQVMEMQLESAKNGVNMDREQALKIVQEKVAKEEKANAEKAAKEAEVKAANERKAYLESAIKNGPADIAESARKELTAINKAEKEKTAKEEAAQKKEAEIKSTQASKTSTKGAVADVKDTKTGKVSSISKTVPSEMAQQRAEEERKKSAQAPKVETGKTASTSTPLAGKTTTLDDLNEQLKQLNKSQEALIALTSEMTGHAEKSARGLKRLDPNMSLRG